MARFIVERVERYEVEAESVEQARKDFRYQFNDDGEYTDGLEFEYLDGYEKFEEVY
jgi:hypothetical protein